ncbi:MAG: hypothetical protein JWQ09_3690, partial [Segetibacter sp.]|nr:hypothetical protein [Segetibacter sp.]
QKDLDILSLDTQDVMKKYKMEKQSVYDRRFALNKKIKQAGLTVGQVINKDVKTEPAPKKTQPKKTVAEKVLAPVEEAQSGNMGLMVVNKAVPVFMKPIEINFDNFSIKLNGVPKHISVNPDTNAVEIEL